ncbi:MAG TPA: DUF222 domain-containing protein [Actinomycetota bacterium]|nr:DUF222 domain-containing protein [Actinomycetota bacterium]
MSELRSVIDQLRADVLAELPDSRLEDDFGELHRSVELLEAERLRRLAEIDRRRLFERDGHLSAAAWLVRVFRVAWGAARDQVRLARALDVMPITRQAVEDGEMSLSSARVLASARDADPAAFPRSEPLLVGTAVTHSPGELQRAVVLWRDAVEREAGIDADERLRKRRGLYASKTFLGMVRLDGDLDPDGGEPVLRALQAVIDSQARSVANDERTPAQRRADALGEICRQWLELAERPVVAGEKPHVTVTVDVRTLSHGDGVAELDHAGPVPAEVARRLACDASVRRVVLSARSEPLDVGRRTPLVPPSMRRALLVRDRRCRFPGCDRAHTWCDAHHVRHWADGGPTALANLILLCRRHHRLVHRRGGFRLELEDGRPVFRRPGGSVLEDDPRGPP